MQPPQLHQEILAKPKSITVGSPSFKWNGAIPREFSGLSDDVSPPLEWSGVPDHAAALAIVVDDPDAPKGTFTHWTVWNLPPRERGLPRDAKVKTMGAREGRNDFGQVGYGGPLPPSGTHRYFFRVFALDGKLDLDEGAAVDAVWEQLRARTLAWGEQMGTFTAR